MNSLFNAIEWFFSCSRITSNNYQGVFIYVGRIPSKVLYTADLHIDEDGYIVTDEFMRTNLPGVFAAGDIRSKQIRQIATAVSDGMIAAINAERDLDRL